MSKITKSTFKSFVKKNMDKLYIRVAGSFDGMTDGIEFNKNAQFVPVQVREDFNEHTLGIRGVWLVNESRDHFRPYEDESFTGIEVSNSCAYFKVAIPKQAQA